MTLTLRFVLNYHTTVTQLQHFGKWVERNSIIAAQLRAMKGEAKVTDVGMQLEYYPLSIIREFYSFKWILGPTIGPGAHYSFFKTELYLN